MLFSDKTDHPTRINNECQCSASEGVAVMACTHFEVALNQNGILFTEHADVHNLMYGSFNLETAVV